MPTGLNVVSCEGVPSLFACGNDSWGGAGGDVFLGVTTTEAVQNGFGYGVLRIGAADTGWRAVCSSY